MLEAAHADLVFTISLKRSLSFPRISSVPKSLMF